MLPASLEQQGGPLSLISVLSFDDCHNFHLTYGQLKDSTCCHVGGWVFVCACVCVLHWLLVLELPEKQWRVLFIYFVAAYALRRQSREYALYESSGGGGGACLFVWVHTMVVGGCLFGTSFCWLSRVCVCVWVCVCACV
mmetsp:Transcript_1992/g.3300  ORF Transcript_1992/g.3300 Transcript_1992/m.3300 type:complete len:139 (-) Transcript_1992:648-1064(-)